MFHELWWKDLFHLCVIRQFLVFSKAKYYLTTLLTLNLTVVNVNYLKNNLESLHPLRLEVFILHFHKGIESDCVPALFLPLTQREPMSISAPIRFYPILLYSRRMTVSDIPSKHFHGTYPSNLWPKILVL